MTDYNFNHACEDASSLYLGDDTNIRWSIANVLLKLPVDVRDFVMDECYFFSAGIYAYGTAWPGIILMKDKDKYANWIILLSEDMPEEDIDSLIAHEIAHVYLGHDKTDNLDFSVEIDAANKAKEWGFSGKGTDIEHQKDTYKGLFDI